MARPPPEIADIFRDHGSARRQTHAPPVRLGQFKGVLAVGGFPTRAVRVPFPAPRTHDRAGWWDIAGRTPWVRLPSKLSLAEEGAVAAVPPPDGGVAARRPRPRPPPVLGRPRPPRRQGRVQGLSRAAAADQVVR